MEKDVKLEFFVLNHNFNEKKVCMYNIFNNIRVYEWTIKEVKKYLRSPKKYCKKNYSNHENDLYGYEAFVEELKSIVFWQEAGRVEYEISAGAPFEVDCQNLEKVDCYMQFEPNKYLVADYVINQYKKYLKEKKKTAA